MSDEFDVVVIGSGPGGYVAAIRCAQLGLKTACVEKDKALGGTCLNVGCIPSKTLLHSSELYAQISHSESYGILVEKASFDFSKMMQRKERVVVSFNQGIDALFKKNRIERFWGVGTLTSANSIEVKGEATKQLRAKNIILATGSEPISLPFLPFDEKRVLSSTGALMLPQVPKKMLIIGAGIIGVELGSVYKRLGAEVVFIEFLNRICPTMDEEVSKSFEKILVSQGLKFYLNAKVTSAQMNASKVSLSFEQEGEKKTEEGDVVLVSIGRKPYVKDLGLEKVGIQPKPKGGIAIDGQFRTNVPNIYAIGDIIDGPMLAHKASEEGIAVAEIITGHRPTIEYMAIPNVIYTNPEVASVGLTESEVKQMGIKSRTGMFPFKINSRAKCTGEEEGFVKIITEEGSDRLLGIHIIGAHASELIAEAAVAIQKKMTALELASVPHAHPTLAEAIKEAALSVHKRPIHR